MLLGWTALSWLPLCRGPRLFWACARRSSSGRPSRTSPVSRQSGRPTAATAIIISVMPYRNTSDGKRRHTLDDPLPATYVRQPGRLCRRSLVWDGPRAEAAGDRPPRPSNAERPAPPRRGRFGSPPGAAACPVMAWVLGTAWPQWPATAAAQKARPRHSPAHAERATDRHAGVCGRNGAGPSSLPSPRRPTRPSRSLSR